MKTFSGPWFINVWALLTVAGVITWMLNSRDGSIWVVLATPLIVCVAGYLVARVLSRRPPSERRQ